VTRKQRRLTLIAAALAVLGVALGLVLFAMRDSIVFFYSPTDIEAKAVAPGTRLRLGGLVAAGSVVKGEGQNVTFAVTDTNRSITVRYTGLFRADSVLAKHDENYMPREVADSLKEQGLWQHSGKADAPAGSPTTASE
jgi:cytochrome c-type biogenesis protein CcmE